MVSLLVRLGLAPAVALGRFLTFGVEKITGRKRARTITTKQFAQTKFGKVLGLATLGTAATLGAVIAGPAAVFRGAASFIPKSTFGKTVVLAVGGAGLSSKTIRKAIIQTPSLIFEKGEEIGLEAERKAEVAGEDKPRTAGAVLLGAAAGLAAPFILGKAKDVLSGTGEEIPMVPTFEALPSELPLVKEKQLAPQVPITPETETVEAGVKKKRARRRTQPRRQTISQRVNVRVGVNAGNRKIIRNVIFT